MEFIINNFWTILFILILAGMGAPEIALSLIVGIMLLGDTPVWVLVSCTVLGWLIREKRINDKNKSNENYFTFTFDDDNKKS